ncbi:NRAMP family divalent metal transporter [Dokdonia donghaensis]|uniref:Iron transporter n=1 Tax=Dokdonia donghaensis DSW-1 TaxID=1300343 RepID=A0A0A2H127_9FLAO|nr:divalent metal cation transporter [Dokdonia donghaensis]ANH61756.1 Natural resistance-associated macrophage protein [Dokdonia donghaensis DSW-1]KGO06340.1 iron transporter [Dokdonia donghaensis DSW-1]
MKAVPFKKLGPGLLFAGAAIGVSHLVQSTRAGADFGFGLLWALILVNIIKYPFFQFGPRYASVTGNSLLVGYKKLGKPVLWVYFFLTLGTMFTIQTAVTIVTAGIAVQLFGISSDIAIWSVAITLLCAAILAIGKYRILDKLMKIIIITLTISTLFAVFFAFRESVITQGTGATTNLIQLLPTEGAAIAFLIAFMGWMPAPLDISIWHSLWTLEKGDRGEEAVRNSIFDFNVGYAGAVVLGVCFMTLGALVMYGSGETFSSKGGVFAGQLINMYTASLGDWATVLIGVAAFTTMFSTTLTTLDASPRALEATTALLGIGFKKKGYLFWLLVLILGTCGILFFLISEMGVLVKLATILSFLTAPFYAICNYLSFMDKEIPESHRLSPGMRVLSIVSIIALVGFSIWYVITLF